MTACVEWLDVAGEPGAWRSIGLVVADDGLVPLMGTSLRIVDPTEHGGPGVVGWTLSGVSDTLDGTEVDGLRTRAVSACDPVFGAHELGASGLDHVVVMTPDLERTSGAIAVATGCELKRVREVGSMRQGFHRIGRGGLIVEIVTRPEIPAGPASFWGLVLNVGDIDAACDRIGPDRVSPPKDAVQPGRRIATIRDEVGLGVPVALMTV
ncbi:VOC family protein [Ilumatobacter nonamiensis]|uniref:VOC family protein n=1 Tax=Ilumatobacter nonamiensis TaxID=467093 RepID=UPI000590BC88|nr:hypothetical protein [Ilumatobacter nonamiensis]